MTQPQAIIAEINQRLWKVTLKWFDGNKSGDVYIFVIAPTVAKAVEFALASTFGDYSEDSVYAVEFVSESVVIKTTEAAL